MEKEELNATLDELCALSWLQAAPPPFARTTAGVAAFHEIGDTATLELLAGILETGASRMSVEELKAGEQGSSNRAFVIRIGL
jgi:hypothetical protein